MSEVDDKVISAVRRLVLAEWDARHGEPPRRKERVWYVEGIAEMLSTFEGRTTPTGWRLAAADAIEKGGVRPERASFGIGDWLNPCVEHVLVLQGYLEPPVGWRVFNHRLVQD
jgi:hypothetical protein